MSLISQKWQQLRKDRKKALVTFITAGDPSLEKTFDLILALEKGGADIIELGVPFSDPMADGPIIQKASERALAKGVTLAKIFQLVQKVRKVSRIPILLMGYYNPILSYGTAEYARDAAKAGVDGSIVVDLPPEESEELDRELKKKDIDLIYLLTPTSDDGRIRKVASRCRGFVYFVSITGITGSKLRSENEIRKQVSLIRKQTKTPIAIGFGITKPVQARSMSKIADGIVIGSALVDLISRNAGSKSLKAKVENFARSMKNTIG
jgi:tryptophan synthase alpha chain